MAGLVLAGYVARGAAGCSSAKAADTITVACKDGKATHSYSGMSAEELVGVSVALTGASEDSGLARQTPADVRAGSVEVKCGNFTKAIFSLP